MEGQLGISASSSPTARGSRWLAAALEPITMLRQYRHLILRIVRREIEQRYRGSVLGVLWTMITPLLMLGVYTFVFGEVFPSRWAENTTTPMPLLLFSGLIIYGIMAEPVNRAPALVLENGNYVKKVLFPLEILAWVALASNFFQAVISLMIWLLIYVVWVGVPPLTWLLLPLALLPVCLLTLGLTWALSALGMFLRDLRHIVPVATTILMFLSPIFFPRSAVPPRFTIFMDLNPLAWTLEICRDVMVFGRIPDVRTFTVMLLASFVVAIAGLRLFKRLRMAFSDVI